MAHIHNYFSIEINNGWGKLVFSQSAVMPNAIKTVQHINDKIKNKVKSQN